MTEVAGAALYDGLYLGNCTTIVAGDLVMITEAGVSVGQGQYKPQFDTSVLEALISPEHYLGFDGVDSYLSVANNAALNLGSAVCSFSMRARVQELTASMLVFKGKIGTSAYYSISFLLNNLFAKFIQNVGNSWSYSVPISSISQNQWFHLVVVKTATEILFYINGANVAATELLKNGTPDVDNTEAFLFGASDWGSGAQWEPSNTVVDVDDFRIYKAELTVSQIQVIYAGGSGKKYDSTDAGAAAFVLNLDEGYGATVTDEIGALAGTLNGGITWHKGGTKFDILTKSLLPYVDKPNDTNVYDMTKI